MTSARSAGVTAAIGRYRVQLQHGDITKETTRAVVNSVCSGRNYGGGDCAKAIKDAAGDSMINEYKRKRVAATDKEELVITEAGNMKQEKILHVTPYSEPNKMAFVIKKILQEAECVKLDSIAFPPLGTGGHVKGDPKTLAVTMFATMRDFVQNSRPNCLHFLKVTIFNEDLFDIYKAVMQEILGSYCVGE